MNYKRITLKAPTDKKRKIKLELLQLYVVRGGTIVVAIQAAEVICNVPWQMH